MNQYLSSKTLKQISREQLLGKYKAAVLAYLVAYIFSYSVRYFATPNLSASPLEMLLPFAITFIGTLIDGIFTLGQCHLYLRISREGQCTFYDITYGFKNYPDKAIGIQFVLTVSELICAIPLVAFYTLMITSKNSMYAIPLAVALIIYAVLTIIIKLVFSQSFYLLNDHPDWKVVDLLKESAHMMKGHKFRLFYIHVSFLGLLFLGLLSMGIGMFWVSCYRNMVCANFYENLIGNLKMDSTSIDITI